MDWLENELKRALARKEPRLDFAERVSGAVRSPAGGRVSLRRWVAVAASVALLAGGSAGYRQYEGIRAKRQVMLAVRLAGGTLNRVKTQVMEAGQ